METWKDVIGYEGLYEVSENGTIRGKDRKDCRGNRISGVEIRPRLINSGYYMVHLRNRNGERKGVLVHRIVAAAFLKPKEGAIQVDHIDENKANNAVSNLRWVTPKENTNHGTGKARAAVGRSVPVLRLSEDGKIEKKYSSATEAARQLGIKQGSITNCCKGRHRHAGGFRWEYAT